MRILVIADVHGKFEVLQRIMDAAEKERFDLVICPGDFTDMFDIPPNFTQLDVADIVIQKLLIPNKPLLCVPGNHDPYELLEVLDDYGVNLHDKKREVSGIPFVGWGGAATPFNTLFEPTNTETEEALSKLLKGISGEWILIVHSPPKGTTLDLIESRKHVGSAAISQAIKRKRPVLAITAHIHENSGTDKINGTTVFYPGPAFEGHYGMVEIENGKVECKAKRVSV